MRSDYYARMSFERAERNYLAPPEDKPHKIGYCDICGWPIYEGDDYEYTFNGLRHIDCKPREGK